ncbi:MAG: CPBP family intramembrane glutamic endopeptidase [Bacteroidota bacterium]
MEKQPILHNIHPSGQLVFTLAVAFFTVMIIVFFGALLAVPFTGRSAFTMFEGINLGEGEGLNLMKYLQVISHLGLFIIPSFIVAWFLGRNIRHYLFLSQIPRENILLMSGVLIFAAVPFINYMLELNLQLQLPAPFEGVENWMRTMEEDAEQTTRAFLSVETTRGLLFNLFMIAVIPAIGEELMFRGVLMRIFIRWVKSPHLAVWITATLFSLIHLQFFGFLPRLILGILFGYLVIWTGSLWPAIIAHFVNNAAAVVFFYFFHQHLGEGALQSMSEGSAGAGLAVGSLMITLLIMYYFYRNRTAPPAELQGGQSSGL